MLTYGDGLSNVNINKLLKFHKDKKTCHFNSSNPLLDLAHYKLIME